MENATKALLIAGSVLIAILLIAIGVKILSSTSGTTEATQSTMDATAVATFNGKFTQYLGKNKAKRQVIDLVNAIIANNATDETHLISISKIKDGTDQGALKQTSDITGFMNELDGNYYDVTLSQDRYEDGCIKCIRIVKVK